MQDEHKSQNNGPGRPHCVLPVFLPLRPRHLQDVIPAALLQPDLQLPGLRQPLQPSAWLDARCRHHGFHSGKMSTQLFLKAIFKAMEY